MRVYAWNQSTKQAWRVELTGARLRRYDNGCLVSIGLTVGTPLRGAGIDGCDIGPSLIARWEAAGIATPIAYDEAMHSGCQSACVRRGHAICRW
jgi:hypothetical protein